MKKKKTIVMPNDDAKTLLTLTLKTGRFGTLKTLTLKNRKNLLNLLANSF